MPSSSEQSCWLRALVALVILAPSGSSSSSSSGFRWTICKSNASPDGDAQHVTPPSQWDKSTHESLCFIQRSDVTSTPGTALFQHWLADFGNDASLTSNNGMRTSHSSTPNFDPWNDFPTWKVMQQYPDIGESDEAREYYTLWYTTTVDVPEDSNQRGHLTLNGVNYQPVVYFNGQLVQPYSTSSDDGHDQHDSGGMFLRRHYDLGTSNSPDGQPLLEILVLPPPHVGKPTKLNNTQVDPKYGLEMEMDQGGDHLIAKSGAIMQFTAGWDWIQSTTDRNVGIWDKVEVDWIEGNVRLHNLHVKVESISSEHDESDEVLPLGNDVTVSALVDLALTATYHGDNHLPIEGTFEYYITPSTTTDVILANGTIQAQILPSSAEYSLGQVHLPHVKLWWPHTHSSRQRQPLYSVKVVFHPNNGDNEDDPIHHDADIEATFGVRTVSSFTHPNTKSFALKVNGHPIFLAGGNWITTDQFLRYSNSQQRYLDELTMLRHVGMNSIRVWGGGLTETQHFYNAADTLGMLVYQEFWMSGDNNGRFAGDYDWPENHDAYLANAKDVILRLRNHPSLVLYGGGNELYPIPPPTPLSGVDALTEESERSPPEDIETQLRTFINEFDDRPYITSSVSSVSSDFDETRVLGPKDGPYGMQEEQIFFDRNPGNTSPLQSTEEIELNINPSDIQDKDSPYRNIGFQTEVGSVSHPELSSLKKFLTQEALDSYPDCGETSVLGGSVHEEWTYFKYISLTDDDGVDHICQFAYPAPSNNRMSSIEEYTWAAQFAQYLQYKSLFEGYLFEMWEWYSAVFLWKASSPAPTFRGALYDWFLETNGGYWGARAGLGGGKQINLILNLQDWSVHVGNMVSTDVTATSIEWNAYTLQGEVLGNGNIPIPGERIDGNTVLHLEESLPWVGGSGSNQQEVQDVVVYRLELSHEQQIIARNAYYLTDPSTSENAQSRWAMFGSIRHESPRVNLDAHCAMTASSGFECTIQNSATSTAVAIMVKLSLVEGPSNHQDPRILPTFFSDNYLTLLPGETSRVQVGVGSIESDCSTGGSLESMKLTIQGWNVEESEADISCGDTLAME